MDVAVRELKGQAVRVRVIDDVRSPARARLPWYLAYSVGNVLG